MRLLRTTLLLGCVGLWLALAGTSAAAQEGHPLVGTWHGTWVAAGKPNDVTLVMEYDGKTITGLVNPGPESMRLPNIVLDPADWSVRFTGDVKQASGRTVHLAIDGKIQDITSRHRSIVGTWAEGTTKGEWKMSLDD
jgi:hypothetical protein